MQKKHADGWWFWLLAAALSLGTLAYGVGKPLVCYFYGKETTATITQYAPRQNDEGHRIHDHQFSYDGHTAVKRFSKEHPIGHQRQMLYLEDHPTWVVSGSKQDHPLDIVDANTNDVGLAVITVVAILSTVAAFATCRAKWQWKRARKQQAIDEAFFSPQTQENNT
ncbi:MAG: hypothetical protein RH917_03335 [Lacipirellulaceae bacterium]